MLLHPELRFRHRCSNAMQTTAKPMPHICFLAANNWSTCICRGAGNLSTQASLALNNHPSTLRPSILAVNPALNLSYQPGPSSPFAQPQAQSAEWGGDCGQDHIHYSHQGRVQQQQQQKKQQQQPASNQEQHHQQQQQGPAVGGTKLALGKRPISRLAGGYSTIGGWDECLAGLNSCRGLDTARGLGVVQDVRDGCYDSHEQLPPACLGMNGFWGIPNLGGCSWSSADSGSQQTHSQQQQHQQQAVKKQRTSGMNTFRISTGSLEYGGLVAGQLMLSPGSSMGFGALGSMGLGAPLSRQQSVDMFSSFMQMPSGSLDGISLGVESNRRLSTGAGLMGRISERGLGMMEESELLVPSQVPGQDANRFGSCGLVLPMGMDQ